ncbi:hypothetical protein K523DRAFT_57998 [Schizophyllum commune Tattone D]|nr:hypothetical protein K523DRAFT_57998 [Schizophyllum commune Tattone D]
MASAAICARGVGCHLRSRHLARHLRSLARDSYPPHRPPRAPTHGCALFSLSTSSHPSTFLVQFTPRGPRHSLSGFNATVLTCARSMLSRYRRVRALELSPASELKNSRHGHFIRAHDLYPLHVCHGLTTLYLCSVFFLFSTFCFLSVLARRLTSSTTLRTTPTIP